MKSSRSQFIEFLSSMVWLDLKDILEERIESTREELEADPDVDAFTELRRTSGVRGRLSELKYIVALPKFLEGNYNRLKEVDSKMNSEEEG